ncbi:trypsin-7-like isoform X1 [Bacillus rossius redtenbacheri]|uniref:trypsin-7-like isoform X1 n=1 Tax=Bacillus rossius redtenbacheri TaxID=93214 RepID=UPI002FDE41ED
MLRLLALLVLAPGGGLTFPTVANTTQFERIMGGSYARADEFPFMLALEDLEEQFCGAVAISAYWAITAAHCVYSEGILAEIRKGRNGQGADDPSCQSCTNRNTPDRMFLRAGSLWRGSGGSVHEVLLGYVPTSYYEGSNNHDIALLKVKRRFSVNSSVRYIQLPRQNEEVEDNTDAIVLGWGSTDRASRSSRKLRKAMVRTMDQGSCAELEMFTEYESHELTDGMLCATKFGRDSRNGDSGGPLLVKEGDRAKLIGIVSWGDGNGNPDWPGIYTKVSRYRNWIKRNSGV